MVIILYSLMTLIKEGRCNHKAFHFLRFDLQVEVSRFPETELHGPDSESEFGRSCPGVGVALLRNQLTYRAVPP